MLTCILTLTLGFRHQDVLHIYSAFFRFGILELRSRVKAEIVKRQKISHAGHLAPSINTVYLVNWKSRCLA